MQKLLLYYFLTLGILVFNVQELFSKSNVRIIDGTRFKSIKCECDNKTIEIRYCYLKAVSRQIVTINVNVKILIPIVKPCYIQLILYYRYGTIFRQAIDTKQVEWCELMNGKEVHQYIKIIIDQLRQSAASLFHKCPYDGVMDFNNITINEIYRNQTSFMFPEGVYRLDIIIFKNQTQTFKIILTFDIKSPLKESFG